MQRYLFLDLARGFTVLFIPFVHITMLYSQPAVHQTWLGHVLRFIAEWPGAQLFMFIMGMNLSFARRSTAYQLKKAFLLFITGYLLNAFKFLIPLWFRWLPAAFLNDMQFTHNRGAINFLLLGDIFQFAGIAMALVAVLKRLSFYPVYAAFICFVVLMASPLLWDLHHHNVLVDHLLHLIGGQPPDCFFPLFPWMIYPLAGLMLGRYLQSALYSMTAIFISGSFLFIASTLMKIIGLHFPEASFYRTWPDESNSHLGFVLIWISIWFWLAKRIDDKQPNYARVIPLKPVINEQKILIGLLCFCSKNITSIYLAQWILIFWLLPLAGYQELDVFHTIFYGMNITAIVLIIAWLLSKKKYSYTK